MTPRLPLALTALAAAALAVPASASTVRPGTWTGYGSDATVTLGCADTARNLHVEAFAAVLPTGRFTGTISYERL